LELAPAAAVITAPAPAAVVAAVAFMVLIMVVMVVGLGHRIVVDIGVRINERGAVELVVIVIGVRIVGGGIAAIISAAAAATGQRQDDAEHQGKGSHRSSRSVDFPPASWKRRGQGID
jgi:hypothetical protein